MRIDDKICVSYHFPSTGSLHPGRSGCPDAIRAGVRHMGKYLAFISYRHKERDQKISGMLQRKLENWHLPQETPIRKKRKVFRDTDELPTSPDLGADLERAIAESGWLIALCSEEYCKSLWCMREIEEFVESGRKDRILPVLLDGTQTSAVPETIRDLPLAADLRHFTGRALGRKVDECIAILLGRMAGEQAEKYAASERRSRVLTRSGVFAAAMAAVIGFALYANNTAIRIAGNNEEIAAATRQAEEARMEAVAERNQAMIENGRFAAEQAWDAINRNEDIQAIRLALAALPEDLHGDEPVSEEALSALRAALNMPGKPKDAFQFSYSVDTDFRITGYISGYDYGGSQGIVLLSGQEQLTAYYLSYPDREIREIDLPKEFYDHRIYDGDDLYYISWQEDSRGAEGVCTTTNYYKDEEPLAQLELDTTPVSAGFSYNSARTAVVDEDGVLSLFDTFNGKKKAVLPGKWRSVYYANSNAFFCAVDDEGHAYRIDAVTLEKRCTYDSPSPVLELQLCDDKEEMLAHCEDGVRIYDAADGRLITQIIPQEVPNQVLWGGYDTHLWAHEGNAVVLLYDNRVDVYEIVTETDLSETDYIPLYAVGVNRQCARAFYSHDSKYVYQQQYSGQLSKWDADTGEVLWYETERWDLQGNVHDDSALSADGNAIWRVNTNMDGLQKIDAATGEKLWEQVWEGNRNILTPEETLGKYKEIAFSRYLYSQAIVVFNTETGDLLWQRENAGSAFWSPAGDEIHVVWKELDEEADVNRATYSRLDPLTGEVIAETVLIDLPYESDVRTTNLSEELGLILLCSNPVTDDGEEGTFVEGFSLETGEPIGTWSFSKKCSLIFSYTGVPVLKWTDSEREAAFCRVLLDGGALGPEVPADSEEGRKLTTVRSLGYDPHDRLLDSASSKYVLFDHDEAALNHVDLEMSALTITRISDGLRLMNLDYAGIAIGCDVAPDGSSICIYGYYTTPRIIRISDPDTLVAKAKRKLEREEGNA